MYARDVYVVATCTRATPAAYTVDEANHRDSNPFLVVPTAFFLAARLRAIVNVFFFLRKDADMLLACFMTWNEAFNSFSFFFTKGFIPWPSPEKDGWWRSFCRILFPTLISINEITRVTRLCEIF